MFALGNSCKSIYQDKQFALLGKQFLLEQYIVHLGKQLAKFAENDIRHCGVVNEPAVSVILFYYVTGSKISYYVNLGIFPE